MARPRPAWAGPTVGMLFSAWQAVTHAPHPVHVSRSTAIPHFFDISAPYVVSAFRRTREVRLKPDTTYLQPPAPSPPPPAPRSPPLPWPSLPRVLAPLAG